jgi:superfamily II DNA/RNA helicase
MHNPIRILVEPEQVRLNDIARFCVAVDRQYKTETLINIFGRLTIQKSVIIANRIDVIEYLRTRMTAQVFTSLQFTATCHGQTVGTS